MNNNQHYHTLTIPKLKLQLKQRGLKVGGIRNKLIERLEHADYLTLPKQYVLATPKQTEMKKKRVGNNYEHRINKLFQLANILNSKSMSKCARSAIAKGYLIFNGNYSELDQQAIVRFKGTDQIQVLTVECIYCLQKVQPTLRNLLEQPDNPDYELGSELASVIHRGCFGTYITKMCEGIFLTDTGEYSKHCTQCIGLGKCIGYYDSLHCQNCHSHSHTILLPSTVELLQNLCSGCCDNDSDYNQQYYYK